MLGLQGSREQGGPRVQGGGRLPLSLPPSGSSGHSQILEPPAGKLALWGRRG